jgi:hypothetical protein
MSSADRLRDAPTVDDWTDHYRRMAEGSMIGKSVYIVKTKRGDARKKPEQSIKAVTQAASVLEQTKDALAEQKARKKKRARRIDTSEDDLFA